MGVLILQHGAGMGGMVAQDFARDLAYSPSMDQLAGLTEKARTLAPDRFGLLQLHLEDNRALKVVAAAPGIPFGTVRRWVSLYRQIGLAAAMLCVSALHAQTADGERPKFEVASIKRCPEASARRMGGGESSPGRLSTGCMFLVDEGSLGLIQRAYVRFANGRANPLGIIRIEGGPEWIHSELYEINARAEGNPRIEMMQGPMMQRLLEERFHLKIHRETREGPVYQVTVGKPGKLKPFVEGGCVPIPLTFPIPPAPSGQRYCKSNVSLRPPTVNAEGSTITEFTKLMNLFMDRPVIDRTGLAGRFDIRLEFWADGATPGLPPPPPDAPPTASEPSSPGIFTAIQEQLGLKLSPAKGPVEVLVIDHIERPSGN